MNKTVAFVSFAVLATIGLAGAIIVILLRPEYSGTVTAIIVNVLGLVTVAAGTFYSLGKMGENVEKIKHQTNGTTNVLLQENMRKEQHILELMQEIDRIKNGQTE